MARGLMSFDVDNSEAFEVTEFIRHATGLISTDRHMDSVLRFAHSEMSEEFNQSVDEDARAYPERYHHVYDWNMIGVPTARLWSNEFRGPPGNKLASWRWRASKKTVPVPSNEEITRADGREHSGTLKQVHVFVWKAPIMEYDISVLIKPAGKGVLGILEKTGGGYILSFSRQSVTDDSPGGGMTAGAFTTKFLNWWGGPDGSAAFDMNVRKSIEHNLGTMDKEIGRVGARSRGKQFGFSTMQSNAGAMAAGRARAEAWLGSVVNRYRAMATSRERFMSNGEEDF